MKGHHDPRCLKWGEGELASEASIRRVSPAVKRVGEKSELSTTEWGSTPSTRRELCWLHSTSVLKRDSFHLRMSPVRPVFSRLLTRVSQPEGRPWLSRSRRLFCLFPKCNPPCVQVCPVFTCYTHAMAARPGPVSPPCNAKGAATSTTLLVGAESSCDGPS
jgi:hypothetical protein